MWFFSLTTVSIVKTCLLSLRELGITGNDAKQVMLVHLKRAIWEGREFYLKKNVRFACRLKKCSYLCTRKRNGAIAQLVEHRTENPCVPGSIPGGTTKNDSGNILGRFGYQESLFLKIDGY